MSAPVTAEDWDQLFSHPNHVYGYRPNEFLKGQSRLFRPGSRILCVCDGEGRNGVWLAEQGWQVTANDISQRVGIESIRFNLDEMASRAEALGMVAVHASVIPRVPTAPADATPCRVSSS